MQKGQSGADNSRQTIMTVTVGKVGFRRFTCCGDYSTTTDLDETTPPRQKDLHCMKNDYGRTFSNNAEAATDRRHPSPFSRFVFCFADGGAEPKLSTLYNEQSS
ncbi:hypothetical protein T4B_6439 [Trichinella pseudospiralis]|uniref:Uncharacterized protein n=2 Tax=Trichinella pseudospiralis TaxID=6337 RepID=A0A0V1F170_TRIPS|nr:hypothetical protein T4E_5333 [Trichinella pseudospiralis]KRY79663.1 hypothetical protein T4A_1957 [Trichinella pseudospiralis]KRY90817.1 hypothetical protein T4D_494 [Trichinella pseudospiralis]KRZ31519.1 hypothetical protein T4B_6439 [Trichinella pseudospiralis]